MTEDTDHTTIGRRSFLKATGAAGAAAAFSGVTAATPGRTPGSKEDEILVLKSNAWQMQEAEATIQQKLPQTANVVHRNVELNYVAVDLPSDITDIARTAIMRDLEETAGVRHVEENSTYYALGTPNDPNFGQQYAPQQVRATDAWDALDGDSSDVTVAVVDQGVDYEHPDLQAQFGSDVGRDFVDDDDDPFPGGLNNRDPRTRGIHGTHVAGITAATRNNGEGVAGISNATLLSGRALSNQGGGSTADIADAVQWAADQGADIINMSLGGGGYSRTMKNAVQYALNQGALPICATGNDANSSVSYPAAYDECVAVSATREGDEFVDEWENVPGGSNYGPKTDVTAPGEQVLSTWPDTPRNEQYFSISGTSMATPAASGVAALGKAADPGLSPTELRSRLKETAVDIGEPADKQGSGRVDALNIVEAGGGTTPPDEPDNEAPTVSIDASSATVEVGQTVTFDGRGSSDSDGSVTSYEWDFGDGTTDTGAEVSHSYGTAGDYAVSLTVTDDDGATSTDSVSVTVQSGGGSCGTTTETAQGEGSLRGYYDSTSFTYALTLGDPCQATVSIDGPAGADFDLYVTTDGRTPTTEDYDKQSITPDSQETVVLDGVAPNQELGILVDSYSGSGSFTVTVEEVGR